MRKQIQLLCICLGIDRYVNAHTYAKNMELLYVYMCYRRDAVPRNSTVIVKLRVTKLAIQCFFT